jgi:endoglucanase
MKGIVWLASILVSCSVAAAAAADKPLSAADQVAQMKRGVNIVGYDPLWRDPAKARFKPRHFRIIKEGGFDTVRINLYGFRQMNDKLELPASWYDILDGLVEEALKQKLNVILD